MSVKFFDEIVELPTFCRANVDLSLGGSALLYDCEGNDYRTSGSIRFAPEDQSVTSREAIESWSFISSVEHYSDSVMGGRRHVSVRYRNDREKVGYFYAVCADGSCMSVLSNDQDFILLPTKDLR